MVFFFKGTVLSSWVESDQSEGSYSGQQDFDPELHVHFLNCMKHSSTVLSMSSSKLAVGGKGF